MGAGFGDMGDLKFKIRNSRFENQESDNNTEAQRTQRGRKHGVFSLCVLCTSVLKKKRQAWKIFKI
jgi:hypothetical protein